jgi:hypothetical protein
MWRVITAISAAAIAAAVILGNLAPADARSGGSGAGHSPTSGGSGGGHSPAHASAVQHIKPVVVNPCPILQCINSDPPGTVGRHPLAKKDPATATSIKGCPSNDPECLEHRHPVVSSFDYNNNNRYAELQPPSDCRVWSHKYHRWMWACGPRYPSYN